MRTIKMMLLVCAASFVLCSTASAETLKSGNVSMYYSNYMGKVNTATNVFTGEQWVLCAGCGRIASARDHNSRYFTLKLLKGQKLVNAGYGYVGADGSSYGVSNWNGKGRLKQYITVSVDGASTVMKLSFISAIVSDPNYPQPPVKGGCDIGGCGK